jgi:HEAT repeat protein/predicted protein tyrosine phosphatase
MNIQQLLQDLQGDDADCRRRSARILGEIGDSSLVEPLLQLLESEQYEVRAWAAWGLTQIGDETAVARLCQILHRKPSPARLWAVWALSQIESTAATQGLLEAIAHVDAEIRWRAVTGLGQRRSARNQILPNLLKLLEDPEPYTRARVAAALVALAPDVAVDSLVTLLRDREAHVRYQAAYTLAGLGSMAVEALAQSLSHADEEVRCIAISALAHIKDERVVSYLVKALHDESSWARARAIDALEQVSLEAAIDHLQTVINDPDPYVALRAQMVLEKVLKQLERPVELFDYPLKASQHPAARVLPKLIITSVGTANALLCSPNMGGQVQYLISIGTKGTRPLQECDRIPHYLRLEFSDIDTPEDDPECLLPTAAQIQQVLDFTAAIAQWEGILLIHCQAGVSRSTAVALAVCAYLLGAGREAEALAYVLEARASARPNRWIVELADALLQRQGKLVEALQAAQLFCH